MLPYDCIDDFILSTLQSVSLPGWNMSKVTQTRKYGKEQEYKDATPVEDLMDKKFTMTFKTVEGFTNYTLFWKNAIDYLNHKNRTQYYDVMMLGMLNNEGYLMSIVKFKKVILYGMSDYTFDYSNSDNSFNKLTLNFSYNDWDIINMYDKMINLYTGS